MNKKSVRKDVDMTQGVIWKQLLWFALPLLIGNIFQQFYNTVDSVIVGNFVGKEALAAVGSVGPIINFFSLYQYCIRYCICCRFKLGDCRSSMGNGYCTRLISCFGTCYTNENTGGLSIKITRT